MPVIQLGEGGRVSIQLVSPARGEPQQNTRNSDRDSVSIQLVSPARGEHGRSVFLLVLQICFHSIGFPCERGTILKTHTRSLDCQFPFNWFPLREGNSQHSTTPDELFSDVSIQLVSPARGEHETAALYVHEGR